MSGEKKVNAELEEMINALSGNVSENPDGNDNDNLAETEEEKIAREAKEAEEANLSDEEKAAKKKEEEEEEARLAAEEEARKNETKEEKEAREKAEAEAAAAEEAKKNAEEAKKKEEETLAKISTEREAKKRTEEEARAKAEKEAKEKSEPLKLEEQDFVGDIDLDELTRDKVAFNKLLNSVYAKGVNDSKQITTEDVLKSVPDMVKSNLTLLTTLREESDKFYRENSDLTPFKRVVAAVFEEIASENPDKKYPELMKLVAPEARKRLNLKEQVVKKEVEKKEPKKTPRLHGTKGGQRQVQTSKNNPSALESEISEMNATLGR